MDTTADRRELLIAGAIVLAICGASLPIFAAVWHRQPFEDLPEQPGGWWGALLFFLAGAAVHELLHLMAWKTLSRLPWRAFSLRRHRRKLGLIVVPDVPIPASAYRVGLVLPAVILGLLPIVIGETSNCGLFVLWGDVFLFECLSDLAILALR